MIFFFFLISIWYDKNSLSLVHPAEMMLVVKREISQQSSSAVYWLSSKGHVWPCRILKVAKSTRTGPFLEKPHILSVYIYIYKKHRPHPSEKEKFQRLRFSWPITPASQKNTKTHFLLKVFWNISNIPKALEQSQPINQINMWPQSTRGKKNLFVLACREFRQWGGRGGIALEKSGGRGIGSAVPEGYRPSCQQPNMTWQSQRTRGITAAEFEELPPAYPVHLVTNITTSLWSYCLVMWHVCDSLIIFRAF